jgi:nucleoside-diphosphate-sugar epimerase
MIDRRRPFKVDQEEMPLSRYLIAGGAGFIGIHMARRLLQGSDVQVVVFDDFSSGRSWHLPDDGRSGGTAAALPPGSS